MLIVNFILLRNIAVLTDYYQRKWHYCPNSQSINRIISFYYNILM